MPTEVHAKLSASGSHRWLNCPGSIKLEEMFPESTSEYAEEGSVAHNLAELKLKNKMEEYEELKKTSKYYSEEMGEAVSRYTDIVLERFSSANKTGEATMIIEGKLDFSPWVKEGFGTGDCVIISEGRLEIIDLKYGKGVPVSAVNNSQMRLYALGAYNTYSLIYDIETVCMTIVQPRLDAVSSEEQTVEDLLKWGETVKPIADLAYEGKGELKAGDHCRFCRAKNRCRVLAKEQLKVAQYEFKSPELLEDYEIADIMSREKMFKTWLTGIVDYALSEAINNGKHWPGFKLVEGKSNRKIVNLEATVSALLQAGYAAAEIYKPQELKTLTDLEKQVGKKHFGELCGAYVAKPEGKPTLVRQDDKRPEWSQAKKDFAVEE